MKFWTAWLQFMSSLLTTAFAFSPFAGRVGSRGIGRLSTSMSIKVTRPGPEEIEKMQIKSWSTWGCGVSKFPWSYSDTETAYLIKGRVTVTPDDKTLKSVTLTPGDMAVFPSGMSCFWDVHESISKYYKFD